MFDHLDDPKPFAPDLAFRRRARDAGRRRRRRHRTALGASTAALVLVGGIGWAAAWTNAQVGRIDRVDVDGRLLDTAAAPDAAVNLLLVGADRSDPNEAGRTDTMMVVRLDPAADRLRVLSVPRDLWVPIGGQPARLNTALEMGGPDLLIETVERELAVPIDHYAEIDFRGVVELVDLAGGVELQVGAPLRDAATGLALESGCQHLDGVDALALLRARRLEVFEDGDWRNDPTGDLGRIERQQAVARLVPALLADLDGHPLDLVAAVDALGDHLRLDDSVTRDHLLAWATWARDLDGGDVATATVPTRAHATEEGASVLLLDGPADGVARFLRGETGATMAPTAPGAVPLADAPC